MECPVCGSRAVIAQTSIPDLVDKVQNGTDPYDLLCSDQIKAECRTCGAIFDSTTEDQP